MFVLDHDDAGKCWCDRALVVRQDIMVWNVLLKEYIESKLACSILHHSYYHTNQLEQICLFDESGLRSTKVDDSNVSTYYT